MLLNKIKIIKFIIIIPLVTHTAVDIHGESIAMKKIIISGLIALIILLALPGAVSAGDNVVVSGSILPPAPVAEFSASPTVGATPLTVTFTDASTPVDYIDSWTWEYRLTGTTTWTVFSNEQEAELEDLDAGYYDIRLTVTNAAGSDDEIKTQYIRVSPGPLPLETIQSGSVSGDLYFNAVQQTPWNDQTKDIGVTQEVEFNFAPSGYTSIEWARLYTIVYVATTDNRECVVSVSFDGNNDETFETVLENAVTLNTASSGDGNVWWQGDHINRVYSDYLMFYDVKDSISSGSVKAKVQTAPGASNMDGRIKYIALVVAYSDGDSDQVKYWVNDGHAYVASMATGETTYATDSLDSGFIDAELKILHSSSKDAVYTFNSVSKPGSNPVSPVNYFGLNTWDVTEDIPAGNPSTLSYFKDTSYSYKTTISALRAVYTAPTAAFTAIPSTIDAGESVAFDASTSTGSITSYAWDFGDSSSESGVTTSHTYTSAGTYTVTLTVDGPMGSDTETTTITVKEPAPVVDFSASTTTPIVGQSVTFTGTNTGGQVNSWTWDFGDGTESGQTATHTYNTAGTYTVTMTAVGPDYTDVETKSNYITVGSASIEVTLDPAGIDFGTMQAGTDSTGSTTVNVDVTYGTPWTVTASATNGGYMSTGSMNLANPFQLSNDGTNFEPMTSNVADFLTGAAGIDGSGTADVKQSIDAADAPGAYSITLTFTGSFA